MKARRRIGLAGQPNAGKSTVFNLLTGARQFVANYPGVTVEKKSGILTLDGTTAELVDLPGTYSLTSSSLEERVARDFLLRERPDAIINVVDASNLRRHLYLTLQLLEMELPVVLALNMMDVATRRGITIDTPLLSRSLGSAVVPTVGPRGTGREALLEALAGDTPGDTLAGNPRAGAAARIDYGEMEPFLAQVESVLGAQDLRVPKRWLAVKLMEGDSEARRLVQENVPDFETFLQSLGDSRTAFSETIGEAPDKYIALRRHLYAQQIARACTATPERPRTTLSDTLDRLVLNRWLGPLILVGIIYALYHLSIVQGYRLTEYTWPLLAKVRTLAASLTPAPGLFEVPLVTSFVLWFVDSINAMLNYIPIFCILFCLIAILEDSGYMPRMAFIMDRIFRRFGLHGHSTLPLILGGVFVGGCAIPGVMACRAIPDERSRLATILIVPMMNCLAKVPLYMLLINTYFSEYKGPALFFIATVTLFMALPTAKALSLTVLRHKESAPFIMELPAYHLPTVGGVLRRTFERLWLFIRKIITVVAVVAVVIFALLQFPGLPPASSAVYASRMQASLKTFDQAISATRYAPSFTQGEHLALILYAEDYRAARLGAGPNGQSTLDAAFRQRNPLFFELVQPGDDREARQAGRALKRLVKERRGIMRDMQKERIDCSILGRIGYALEPLTRYAGFNWRINVALLSSFAAKESSVATLGALYRQGGAEGESLEEGMQRTETGFTPLHALALMIFMALFPPCIPAAIAVRLQSGATRWMLFAIFIPTLLGLTVASLVFSGARLLGLSGWQAMWVFYAIAVALTLVMAAIRDADPADEDLTEEEDIPESLPAPPCGCADRC